MKVVAGKDEAWLVDDDGNYLAGVINDDGSDIDPKYLDVEYFMNLVKANNERMDNIK